MSYSQEEKCLYPYLHPRKRTKEKVNRSTPEKEKKGRKVRKGNVIFSVVQKGTTSKGEGKYLTFLKPEERKKG